MASLADLPNLIGFFSYSRNDDEGDDGAVAALANRIYRELRSQLGRTDKNFKLWRDKDALAAGDDWNEKLTAAVSESVFFIMMVSPSALNSSFCRFEFDSFIKREKELGRDDLIFPILYIPVPHLQDSQIPIDPVISIVKDRQYEDWRPIRHRHVNSTEVKQTVEQFCSTIAKKLRAPWISTEERKAKKRAEERHRKRIDQAAKRAEEESFRASREPPKKINRPKTIAVTGTMEADTSKLRSRIERLLHPYLQENTIWYCGGRGTTDELVIEYLIKQGVHPIVVDYKRYELSPIVKKMNEKGNLTIIEVSTENVPQFAEAPTQRDMFFASKADIVILFWDRDSVGTKRLIEFFTKNGTNMLLGFI
jgi:hypothetical protein